MFIARKNKDCINFNEYELKEEKKTYKAFQDAKRLLPCKQYFDFLKGDTICGYFPLSWKTSFDGGDRIPSEVKNCKDCLNSETERNESC